MATLSQVREYDPYSAAFKADPWPVYRWLRDEHPVYASEKWGFVALSRFEDVRAAARDHEHTAPTRRPELAAQSLRDAAAGALHQHGSWGAELDRPPIELAHLRRGDEPGRSRRRRRPRGTLRPRYRGWPRRSPRHARVPRSRPLPPPSRG